MKRALIGYGGHAREVMSQMRKIFPCFVDDIYANNNTIGLSKFDPSEFEVMIAIGDSLDRCKVANKLPKGTRFFSFIHPTAIVLDGIEIGEGSFIGAYSILTNNIRIGKHSLLSRGNHIGHDSVVGDYLSMMPGSIISGNCILGDRLFIGTNASIKQKIKICDDVTIGLNSGVVRDIDSPGIYVGTPSLRSERL